MINETQGRVDLAAAFRWAARLNFHEATANHFSLAISEDGAQFLLNPRGGHFSRIWAACPRRGNDFGLAGFLNLHDKLMNKSEVMMIPTQTEQLSEFWADLG